MRVANVLKLWLETYINDFEDEELREALIKFLDEDISKEMSQLANSLKTMLSKDKSSMTRQSSKTIMGHSSIDIVKPISPIGPEFIDFDETEIARQLSLLEMDIFKQIRPEELLGQAWTKEDKEIRAPNIMALTRHFNTVSSWVSTEIVREEKVMQRVKLIKKFIDIAKCLMEIGNFNGFWEILAGIQNSAIFRLKKTWQKVQDSKQWSNLQDMLIVIASNDNHKAYRERLRQQPAPCIPFLGLYLTSLTFIEDGNSNQLYDRPDLINFEKKKNAGPCN